jgi:tetratricopeptide (TPR) repeat protein
VHNEILQAATDYGIIGAGLLLLWVGSVVVGGIVRAAFGERSAELSNEDSWRAGGLAGLLGILIQSHFSFVFHLVPGALLLGICLGRAAHPGGLGKTPVARAVAASALATLVGLAAVALLVPMGWLGARVTAVRWADGFGRPLDVAPEIRLRALNGAIELWPLQEFFVERGLVSQAMAAEPSGDGYRVELLERAMADYAVAAKLNPFDPRPVVNRANLLGMQGRDAEAEQAFELAVKLQGGMEAAYRGGYSKAAYFLGKGRRLLVERQVGAALQALLEARDALEKSCVFPSGAPLGKDARALRIGIAERLGGVLAMVGRDAEAEFEKAAQIPAGAGIRYYHASYCYTKARKVFFERRPAEALRLFLKGRGLIVRTGPALPAGVSREDQLALREELDKNIQFLKGAKIEPAEPPPN